MKPFRLITLLLCCWVLAPQLGQAGLAPAPESCLECHADSVSPKGYAASVHGHNACTSCHMEITNLRRHEAGEIAIEPVNCNRCHKKEASEHQGSVHLAGGIGCSDCHSGIHDLTSWRNEKQVVVDRCLSCHDFPEYLESTHGRSVMEGNADSAACNDCHGLHAISSLGEPGSREKMAFHTSACMSCHGNREMMDRAGLSTLTVKTYLDNYHGKGYRLGFPEQTAGCADCHTAHRVLPADHAASSIHPENLIETCGSCHPNATGLFTRFYPHGDHHDRANYPVLWWTYISMTSLLVGTFAIFWIHTLLWMFRGFVENREKVAALAHAAAEKAIAVEVTPEGVAAAVAVTAPQTHVGSTSAEAHAIADGQKQYLRFEKRHIYLHLTVIISFLGLSLTGLPLKFADQQWARTMMSFFGGVHFAGLIHRGCAILTFYYFLGALIMSFDFLFVRKDVRTRSGHQAHWLQRLFGPDSLMPNFRDLQDIKGMVKWFFFRGPKPTFERWTYWEKFDFLAVFWGMFAIGGSGLLLWFPELFGRFLPGWMFNVATIVHSDEALLATGFIFTVHFFNTHGRPEKFPMDFVIFNGQISKEEFIHERGDQWRRYQELGILEQFEAKKTSGVLYDFLFKGFGFLALFTGLALAFLMFYAFVNG